MKNFKKTESFFIHKQNQKQKQNVVQTSKIKNVYWSISTKIGNPIQFPTKGFLTSHR